ncbi:Aste57867_19890 [Aphanomyces stellatus]|uniref:HECT-type E3 ubiquitin transferase n=1 Tax=Aphanomyces stellatus TaxID=120398 RepID=A0A485LDQ3_9STRA|nr:hypothetical protein As57867_019824 [Aphanomyces stellatus]VFT96588.1 Aste57867_19890 [Aphanomyces stellatus]
MKRRFSPPSMRKDDKAAYSSTGSTERVASEQGRENDQAPRWHDGLPSRVRSARGLVVGGACVDVGPSGSVCLVLPAKARVVHTERCCSASALGVGHILLQVNRTNLLQESCECLLSVKPDQLHQSLRIEFVDEPGVDAGGLEREWFTRMTHEIFNPATGLFTASHNSAYIIETASAYRSDDHLLYFMPSVASWDAPSYGILIDAHLVLPLYKHIVGTPISFSDLEFVDLDIYTNLKWLKHSGWISGT